MFTFYRTRKAPAEFWDILVAKDSLPNAEKRFGPALMYRGSRAPEDMTYHEVGKLSAIVTEGETEFLMMHKELSDEEQRLLAQELELLFGQEVWDGADETTKGFYLHATLKPWTPSP